MHESVIKHIRETDVLIKTSSLQRRCKITNVNKPKGFSEFAEQVYARQIRRVRTGITNSCKSKKK